MEIFEPDISLIKEPDGEYTALVVVISPNSSYQVQSVEKGPPSDVVVAGNAKIYRIGLGVKPGAYVPARTSLQYEIQNLDLNQSLLLVFVTLGSAVVGQASVTPDRLDRVSVAPGPPESSLPTFGISTSPITGIVEREPLQWTECLDMSRRACGAPVTADQDDKLGDYNVKDDNTVSIYKSAVQAQVFARGFSISRSKIIATPQTTIGASAVSIHDNYR